MPSGLQVPACLPDLPLKGASRPKGSRLVALRLCVSELRVSGRCKARVFMPHVLKTVRGKRIYYKVYKAL